MSCVIHISKSKNISIPNDMNIYIFIMSFHRIYMEKSRHTLEYEMPLYAQVFEYLILSLLAQFWECGTSVHSSWDEFFLKEAVTLGQSQVCTLRLHFLSCHSASKNCIMSSLPDRLSTLKPWDISLPPSGCFLSSICSDTR